MELHNIELSEIAPFFDSIGQDKELVMMDAKSAMASRFVTGIRSNNELVGLAGIRMRYGLIPSLFIVVKVEYRRTGLGSKLLEKCLPFAQENYGYLTLATRDTKEYEPALRLYKKYGFQIFRKSGHHIRMCVFFNKKGKIASKFLPYVYFLLAFGRFRKEFTLVNEELPKEISNNE